MKKLIIGKMNPRFPVMQGALGFIDSSAFVANMARAGAIGVIASLGLTPGELRRRILDVRSECNGNDIFGVNLLVPSDHYHELLKVCIEEHVDFVELAGGIDKKCDLISKHGGPSIICKVSSLRLAQYAEQLGAAAITVMGKEAGGHLGFPNGTPFISTVDLVRGIKPRVNVPVIAAGGAVDAEFSQVLFEAGADAIQIGTRLLTTNEFESHQSFKDAIIKATHDDVIVINSPFGLPLRALDTRFARGEGRSCYGVEDCVGCLPTCSKNFCLRAAMRRAVAGEVEQGIIPASEHAPRIGTILPLRQVLLEVSHLS